MPKKKSAASDSSDSDSGPDDRNPTPAKKAKKTEDGEFKFDLGKSRQVTVRAFKGKTYIDIREFYEKDGELKPGKKGISLTPEQWKTLLENTDAINDAIKQM